MQSIFLLPIPEFIQHLQSIGYNTLCRVAGLREMRCLSQELGVKEQSVDPRLLMPGPALLWLLHLSSRTQGLSCQIFSNLEHHWRGSSLSPCRQGLWRMS